MLAIERKSKKWINRRSREPLTSPRSAVMRIFLLLFALIVETADNVINNSIPVDPFTLFKPICPSCLASWGIRLHDSSYLFWSPPNICWLVEMVNESIPLDPLQHLKQTDMYVWLTDPFLWTLWNTEQTCPSPQTSLCLFGLLGHPVT